MFRVIELQNFRGFEEARLAGLARINLLTGLNGSGKTSILEAAFLISGAANASLVASLYGFRGEHEWMMGVDRPFRSLFRYLDPGTIPQIVASSSDLLKTSKRFRRELQIKPTFSVGQGQTTTSQPTVLKGVTFEFNGPSGKVKSNWGWTADAENFLLRSPLPKSPVPQSPVPQPPVLQPLIPQSPALQPPLPQSPTLQPPLPQLAALQFPFEPKVFLGGDPVENPDLIQAQLVSPYVRDIRPSDHEILTRLLTERRIGEVVDVLKLIAPALKAFHPLTENSSPVIYADLGGNVMLPIALLGSGLVNCLHIVLPCLLHENATILIDEFEDGIHHSLQTPLLKIVFDLAHRRKHQLFITTHSNELLRHVISLANEETSKDIAFFRLGRLGLKGLIPRYSLSEAESLLDANLDIR